MDFAKEWTICVCITLIISVVLSVLTPSGKLSSFYKIIISIFIFMSFIYPFSNFKMDDFKFNYEYEDKSPIIVESMIDNQVKTVLTNHDIIGANVKSSVYQNNEEIIINSVEIYIPDMYDKTNVENIIFDELSINSKVIYIGS